MPGTIEDTSIPRNKWRCVSLLFCSNNHAIKSILCDGCFCSRSKLRMSWWKMTPSKQNGCFWVHPLYVLGKNKMTACLWPGSRAIWLLYPWVSSTMKLNSALNKFWTRMPISPGKYGQLPAIWGAAIPSILMAPGFMVHPFPSYAVAHCRVLLSRW